jgi:glutamate synthase (NADPH/NADH) small chain
MPGNPRDEALAREEGTTFQWLVDPVEILSDDEGRVRGLKCLHMRLGEADESGRPSPEPIQGSEFEIPADTVVFAVGSIPDSALAREVPELEVGEGGVLLVDPSTGRTPREMVWAGGECVTGPSPVALAVSQARRAASDIHQRLSWT